MPDKPSHDNDGRENQTGKGVEDNQTGKGGEDGHSGKDKTMLGNCGFSRHLGMRIVDAGPDFAVVEMPLGAQHLNGHAICHGGAIFALADTAFAHACNSDNIITVAQQCQVNFLQPGRGGDTLTATATARTNEGRTGLYDIRVANQDGGVIAEFRGMSRKLKGEVVKG